MTVKSSTDYRPECDEPACSNEARPRLPRKRIPAITHAQAQRIRFGILAARHSMERDRLTPEQEDYLEGYELSGGMSGNVSARRAHDRERLAALARTRP